MREAMFYQQTEDGVRCTLCPHHCELGQADMGLCGVRGERNGKLYALSYGKLSAEHVDPVEKKPLALFMPGTKTYSIGSYGCNMNCQFCQNHLIARSAAIGFETRPSQVIDSCIAAKCPSISYTYNEPTTMYEYMYDTARLAKAAGLKNILVTNGCVEEAPLRMLLPYIDAVNIDIKCAVEGTYAAVLGGSLEATLRAFRIAAGSCHVEVTTLMVPGLCDDEDVEMIAEWIAEVDADIPLHLSRYFPRYNYTEAETPIEDLRRAQEVAKKHLNYVFLGNV